MKSWTQVEKLQAMATAHPDRFLCNLLSVLCFLLFS